MRGSSGLGEGEVLAYLTLASLLSSVRRPRRGWRRGARGLGGVEGRNSGGAASSGGATDARGPQRARATEDAQRRREKAALERERNLRLLPCSCGCSPAPEREPPLLVRLLARPPRIPRRRRRREIPRLRDGGECRPPATPALSTLRCCSGVSAGEAR